MLTVTPQETYVLIVTTVFKSKIYDASNLPRVSKSWYHDLTSVTGTNKF